MNDKISLMGVECRVKVGVPSAERRRRQKILIDVVMEVPVAGAGARDDFRMAVDYWGVEKAVRETAETGERQLIEALAEQVAAAVLRRDKRIAAVTIAVHKRPAVMPKTREVVVEIRRP